MALYLGSEVVKWKGREAVCSGYSYDRTRSCKFDVIARRATCPPKLKE